jgi:hypothetical protein
VPLPTVFEVEISQASPVERGRTHVQTRRAERSRAPSFTMIRLMCVLAVAGLTTSRLAISSMESPSPVACGPLHRE